MVYSMFVRTLYDGLTGVVHSIFELSRLWVFIMNVMGIIGLNFIMS